jgi:trans-2,3-dihydro-3-hydroxyanthranilate isomerase
MPSINLRYLHLDVFTSSALEGNQLAVFPQPAGLTTDRMQAIAREMNFSESTFVFPPEVSGTNVRMRIFTPAEELPMAGHPVVGSTFALAAEGAIAPGTTEFVYGLNIGPTPVTLEWTDRDLAFVWMTQRLPAFDGQVTDRPAFAASIGVGANDLVAGQPVEVVSCGLPYLMAALTTRAAVDRVVINRSAYVESLRASGINETPLFVFTQDRTGWTGNETVYSRMLAPAFGIAEDPATGSASGPLGCYLAAHGDLTQDVLRDFVSLQGAAMKRPSRIHVSIDRNGRDVARVRVGGRSVIVGEGTLRLP